jgi:hypothetical protein
MSSWKRNKKYEEEEEEDLERNKVDLKSHYHILVLLF